MRTNHTDITIVLDRSGSMYTIVDDTIGGFNRFLDDQKKAPGTATLSLNQFDDVFDVVMHAADIQNAKPLTRETFIPRGNTALLDAIGRSVVDTGKRLERTPEHERPGKVVIVVITDGYENSSRNFSADKIAEMIRHQRDVYQWEFVFLAANQDAITSAAKMGIAAANAMTYAANTAGTNKAFSVTSANLTQMRAGYSRSMAYSDEDRAEQRKAGAAH